MSGFKQYLTEGISDVTYSEVNSAKRLKDLPEFIKYLTSKEGIKVLLDDIHDWGVELDIKENPEILSYNTYRSGGEYAESVKYIVDIFDFIEATIDDYLTQYVYIGGPNGRTLKSKTLIDKLTKKIMDILKKDMSYLDTLLKKSMENKIVKLRMPEGNMEKMKIISVLIVPNTKAKSKNAHSHALSVYAEKV